MSTEGYANFLRNMGHKVRKTGDIYWFNTSPHIYMSFPFHKLIDPYSINIENICGSDGLAIRYPCKTTDGRQSYRIVIDDPSYDLTHLSGKARNQTKRGLENCEVRQIEFNELNHQGIELNKETLKRQGRKISKELDDYWMRYYSLAGNEKGAEAWGAYYDGMLAAYLISFYMDKCQNILIVRSSSKYLKYYPNNALLFTYITESIRKKEVDEISIGLESIQHGMEGLDKFKLGMGFKKVPIGQRVEFRIGISWLLHRPILNFIRVILKILPKNEALQKLEGLFDWYQKQKIIK